MTILLSVGGAATQAFAADFTWTGTTNNTWSTAANWGGTTPANAATTAVFFGTPASGRVAPNLTSSVTVGSITFLSGASAFTISRSSLNTLTLATGGSVTNSSSNLQTITAAVVLGGSSTWDAASGNMSVSGVISGASGSLTKTGLGLLTLSGVNTYAGGTTISAGTLQVGNGGRLGTGGVTNNGVLTYNSTGTITEANVISGTGSLTQIGAGVTSLTATNTYQGGTTISGGVLQFSSLGNFGSGAINLNGGALRWATGSTVDVSGIVTLGGGAFDTNGNNVTLGSALAGSAPLIKAGTGILTLNAAPASATTVTVSGGTLLAGGAGFLPSGLPYTVNGTTASGSATLNLNGYGLAITTLTLGGSTAGANAVNTVATGSGILTLGGNVAYAAPLTGNDPGAAIITGKLDLGSSTRTFNIADSTNTATELSISAAISGTGVGLIKTGSGVLALTGTNTYTGGTTVSDGTLQFSSSANFGSGPVTMNGFYAILRWATGNTDGLAGGIAIGNYGRLDTNGNNVTLATPLSGSGRMTKEGTGILTLVSAPNLAEMFVHGGTLRLTADNSLPSSAKVTVAGIVHDSGLATTLDLDGHNLSIASLDVGTYYSGRNAVNIVTTGAGTLTVGGNVTYAGQGSPYEYYDPGTAVIAGKLALGAGTHTFNIADSFNTTLELNVTADISGAGGLTKSGAGNLVLSGTNTYAGDTTISAGLLRAAVPATGNLRMNGGVLELAGDRAFTYGTGPGQIQWTGSGGGFSAFGGNRTVNIKDGGETSLNLVWGGGSFVAAGSSLMLSSSLSDSTVTLANNIDLNGTTRGVTVDAGSAATDAVLSGVLSNGGLSVTGAGTLKLAGANTYAGGTTISGREVDSIFSLQTSGAVVEFSSGGLGSGGVTLENGSQLRWAPGNTDSLTGATVNIGAGGATLHTNGNNVVLNAALGGVTTTSQFGKTGDGVLTLNVASTFSTGYATISGGTLRLGVAGAFGTEQFGYLAVNAQTAGGSATFDTNGQNFSAYSLNFGGAYAQANAINTISTGAGTLFFTKGGISYTRANLAANDPGSAFLTGNLNLYQNTAVFTIEDSSNTTAELTVSANISSTGTLGLTKSGAGTLVLSGNNTYTGTTTLSAGTLRVTSSTALGTGTLSYGGGTLELAGTNLALANTITLGSSVRTISVVDGSAVVDATLTGGISGSGAINKTGAGTLRLSGAKTYTGNTNVSAGTLIYATQNSLYNNVTGNWTATKLTVQSGATAAFNVGGTNEFTATNINTLKVLGGATNGFRNGSFIGFDTTNALGGNFDYVTGITNTNSGANVIGLTKLGTGSLTLSGASTYTGATTVSAGTLFVNGSLGNTAVAVSSGATLGGSGTTAGLATISSGGRLAPGNSPGTLTFTNGLTLNSGSILDFQIGTTSDSVRVSGATLTGPLVGTILLNLSDAGGFNPLTSSSYTLFNFASAATSNFTASQFTLGSLLGGTSLSNYTFNLDGTASTLNLVYTPTAVPEPATYAAIFGAAALLVAAFRRKRAARL